MNERTNFLKKQMLNSRPKICSDRAKIITNYWKKSQAEPILIRRAKAIQSILENMRIYINPKELIVGNQASAPRSAPIFPEFGVNWLEAELDSIPKRDIDSFIINKDTKLELQEIFQFWKGKTHYDRVSLYLKKAISDEIYEFWDEKSSKLNNVISLSGHIATGDGHVTPGYGQLLNKGIKNFKSELNNLISNIDLEKSGGYEKALFYESILITCSSIVKFAKRFSKLAKKEIQLCEIDRKKELEEIIECCNWVPENSPRNFREALQSLWFLHLAVQIESNGHSISFGRFDQYLYPYLYHDLNNNTITKDKALELLECFWIKTIELNKIRQWSHTEIMHGYPMFQTLTIGGQKSNGEDATNDLTYLCLKATENVKIYQPTTVVRIHSKSPIYFLNESIRSLRNHGSLPAFFNDEIIIPALLTMKGIHSIDEARNYSIIGCSELGIEGKTNTITGGVCHINLLKILQLTIDNQNIIRKYSQYNSEDYKYSNFNRFFEELKDQFKFYLKLAPVLDKAVSTSYKELTPTPLLSSLMPPRINIGKDISLGYGEYGGSHNQMLIFGYGSANIGNSLASLKKIVYDDQIVNIEQFKKILNNNFSGKLGENIHKLILENIPKYGNGDEYVDDLMREALGFFMKEAKKLRPPRGGEYAPTLQTLSANVAMGKVVGATPDGRKAKEPIADNVSPAAGTDINGPTTTLLSVSRIEHELATNGTIVNMKFAPNMLADEKINQFSSLIRTFFIDLKGFQIQFNIYSLDQLKNAQKHPKEFSDLVVKVAGYNAFFTDLNKELQNEIIKRTEFELIS